MKIVFLGWGSLIWFPDNLSKRGEWFRDGPCLPVESARISNNGRLILVLYPYADRVRVLWVYVRNWGGIRLRNFTKYKKEWLHYQIEY